MSHNPNKDPSQTQAMDEDANIAAENEMSDETLLDIPLEDIPTGAADISENANGEAEARIAELEVEVAELKDKLLRTLAETENIRKRSEKERHDTAKFAVGNFAKKLLSVADNLRRALDAISEEARSENEALNTIFVGVEATERELLRAFEGVGITKITALDTPFNPNFHEVMLEMEMPEKSAGTVVQELDTGYMIHDRLLRPARVAVAKGGAKPEKSNIDQEV